MRVLGQQFKLQKYMKAILFVFLLIQGIMPIIGQNYFKIGMEYSKAGDYSKADSFFILHLKRYPADKNARFNHGTMKLYQGDTCSFCDVMLQICHFYLDKDACKLCYSICGKSDTSYYDKDYIRTDNKRARYLEITENHRYLDYQTVIVHDKKNPGETVILNSDIMNPLRTDIIAIYNLYKDSSKVFTYTLTPPLFPGGDDAKSIFREKNYYIQKAKNELNMSKLIANVSYIIDRYGNVRDINLISISYKVENIDRLKEYINDIIINMPKQMPAKFRGENVDYLVQDFISFW